MRLFFLALLLVAQYSFAQLSLPTYGRPIMYVVDCETGERVNTFTGLTLTDRAFQKFLDEWNEDNLGQGQYCLERATEIFEGPASSQDQLADGRAPNPPPEPNPAPIEEDPISEPVIIDPVPEPVALSVDRIDYPEPEIGPYRSPNSATRMPQFELVGAWRHQQGKAGSSERTVYMKGGFSVCGDSIWMTTDQNAQPKAIVEYRKPALVKTYDKTQMPVAQFAGEALEVEPWRTAGTHLSQVFCDEEANRLIVTNHEWYDANKSHKDFVVVMDYDGSNRKGYFGVQGQKLSAGNILKTPKELEDLVGGRLYMHGEHWSSIVSSYSMGPSLAGWDGILPGVNNRQDGDSTIKVDRHLYFPFQETHGEHGTNNQGGCPAADKPQRPANAIMNRQSRYEVSFFWKGSYISIGQQYGQEAGLSYGHPPYGGPKGTFTCIKSDRDSYFWVWDRNEIFSAENPWDPRPIEWGYLRDFLPQQPFVNGAYFDPDDNMLYLLSKSDKQGDEFRPVIYQYRVQ
ncbi:MAG: hypothetical protein AAF098_04160 [Pseudomonadota bacterium]